MNKFIELLTRSTAESGRNSIVTGLCILGFIAMAISFLGVLMLLMADNIPELKAEMAAFGALPSWYPLFVSVMIVVYLVSLIYIWNMKKVGLLLITVTYVVNLIVDGVFLSSLLFGEALVTNLLYMAVIGVLWTQYSKMK